MNLETSEHKQKILEIGIDRSLLKPALIILFTNIQTDRGDITQNVCKVFVDGQTLYFLFVVCIYNCILNTFQVIERHKLLLPRVKDTQVKSEVKTFAML